MIRAIALAMLVATTILYAVWNPEPRAMAMPAVAFPTHSKDITKEAAEIAEITGLKPGSTIGEVGGGNGTLLINLAPKVKPGGEYFGTGHDQVEVDGMESAASKAGLTNAHVYLAQTTVSGLPAGCCDAIVLRMVYHMLDHPAEYLADFKRALRPNGKLLILEHNPDNGKKVREGAKLTVAMAPGKNMDMPVVPQEAMIEEAKSAGFAVVSKEPFEWEYFTGPHYVNSKDGRGYGIVFMKPEDVSPPKPFCNCACGGSGQCGVSCSSCDCEGCAPAPSPPPPPKPLCNCGCGGAGQCGIACSSCDCEGCMPVKPSCNKACGSAGQCGVSCSPCDCE